MGSNHLNEMFGGMSDARKHLHYKEDPLLFIQEKWIGLNSKSWNIAKIDLFPYQETIINKITATPFTLIASSRQMGISTLIDAYIAWYALFNTEKEILIVSNNSATSIEHLERIKLILMNYKVDGIFDFDKDCKTNNKKEVVLSNGCRIIATSPSADAGRGYGIDLLFFDNAAYIKHLEDIYIASAMAVSSRKGSKIIMASSASDNSFFNKLALKIRNNDEENSYSKLLEIKWDMHPQRTNEWYDEMCRSLGYDQSKIDQELDCVINYKDKSNKDKTISLRLPYELYKQIKIKIGEDSVSDYIRNLIEKGLRV